MKDLDFDEIDKAVAGALASEPTAQPSTVTPPAQVEKKESEPAQETAIELSLASKPAETTEPVEEVSRSAPAVRRSSGRFMDVVHPSSDMRGRSTFTPPVAPVVPAADTPVVEPEHDVMQSAKEPTLSFEDSAHEAWSHPLESPFLPDAKVEKRPLGGVSSSIDTPLGDLLLDDPDELRIEAPDEPRLEAPDEPRIEATTMPDPIDFAAHSSALPTEKEDTGEEEQPVSEPVEGEVPPAHDPVAQEALESALASELEETKEPEQPLKPVEEKPVKPTPAPQELAGPTSITQQYVEQPSTADAPGAMYDTEAYHQPIVPVVKKKSGIWVILWILLLIALGAGAGVVFYLFVLPLL